MPCGYLCQHTANGGYLGMSVLYYRSTIHSSGHGAGQDCARALYGCGSPLGCRTLLDVTAAGHQTQSNLGLSCPGNSPFQVVGGWLPQPIGPSQQWLPGRAVGAGAAAACPGAPHASSWILTCARSLACRC